MTRACRPLIAVVLALLLVLTAQAMAVARGMPGVAGAVVLCTGTGPVTVLTDAEGQPVGPAHICPDCTLSLIVALAQAGPVTAHPMGRAVAVALPAVARLAAREIQPFSARDPPAVV
ncbi:MAG: hypothetical protein R3197_19165 [Paracoccaceae bacterium]|jgi:hypothetical protein|nr:hypothetical protein [Paracoccaceae bacterium]